MKKLTLTLALLVTVTGSVFASHNSNETKENDTTAVYEEPVVTENQAKVAIIPMQNKRFRVIVDQESNEFKKLKIYDENGLVHRAKYDLSEGFAQVYDLSRIDSDNFTFVLFNETGEETISVSKK
jgi:hypothetical protein